jgi:hypothetical protein
MLTFTPPHALAQSGVDSQCLLVAGGTISRALFVDDAATTAFTTRPSGCTYGLGNVGGRPFQAEGLDVVQRPRHGRIGVQGRVSFAYIPAAGFVGSDVFQIRYHGIRDGQRRTTVITFEVSVER